jgi:hypothetical protein
LYVIRRHPLRARSLDLVAGLDEHPVQVRVDVARMLVAAAVEAGRRHARDHVPQPER